MAAIIETSQQPPPGTVLVVDGKVDELKREVSVWSEQIAAIEITDQASYDLMALTVVELTELERRIVEHHAPIKKATDFAHKTAVKAEKDMLLPVQTAKAQGKLKIVNWDREQERIRREEERRLREEAARREEDLRLQAAVEMEQTGATKEEVETALAQPSAPAPAPVAHPTYEKAQGISTREVWSARIDSIVELCKAIAEGRASAELVLPNTTALNGMARAMRSTMNVPGVTAVCDTTLSVRTR